MIQMSVVNVVIKLINCSKDCMTQILAEKKSRHSVHQHVRNKNIKEIAIKVGFFAIYKNNLQNNGLFIYSTEKGH